ncbi:MAG TPA: PEP/pyruvate-binding domain-containing protein [Spirochaetota bacterium]|nr:PEP/pyruvate-binding domain-containing protein [Spirochaetota bacterium]
MFYRFGEITDLTSIAPLIGKKAESLVRMAAWGLPVPDGGCVTTRGFDEFIDANNMRGIVDDIRSLMTARDEANALERAIEAQSLIIQGDIQPELMRHLAVLQEQNPASHFAVRSSGTKEDLVDASFAGQYTSILNVKSAEHLALAVKQCWASLFYDRVLRYCLNKGIDFSSMGLAVVVQRMIPAEKSGVIFTVNPLTGHDTEILIEACFGIGEALVSGEVTPDQYFFDWFSGTETKRVIGDKRIAIYAIDDPPFVRNVDNPEGQRTAAVLSPDEVRTLATIAVDIQARYGFPVDIEWAQCNGEFFIVQSRPITTINHAGIEGEWTTADFKDGGVSSTVCSQFMWSLYDLVWETAMPSYLIQAKLYRNDPGITWGDMFYGRPYWNAGAVKAGVMCIPGFNERKFDEDLGIQVAYEGDGHVTKITPKSILAGLRVLNALNTEFKKQMDLAPQFKERQLAKLAELDRFDPSAMPRGDFYAFYERFIYEEYFLSESTYFTLIFYNSNLNSIFKESFEAVADRVNLLNLISGLTDLSHMIPVYRMWDLKKRIAADASAYDYWKRTSVADLIADWRAGTTDHCMDAVREYIDEVRFHSTRELDITVPRYGEDPAPVMESVKNSLDLDERHDPRELTRKQHDAYLAEREKYLAAHPFWKRRKADRMLSLLRKFLWWREELRDLSTKYYHQVRRFTLVMAGHLASAGAIEQPDDIFFLPVRDVIDIAKGVVTTERARALVRRNRRYYESFRNYANPNEIGSRYAQKRRAIPEGQRVLNGIASSPGQVTGRVKVIRDIFDADRLEKGDILITRFTDPGWTPKFSLLAGVATETGGLLSHAAVISREYGIPAVLAVDNITAILHDGQEVTIDGDAGMVHLLN